ncbi:hypothetical protein Tco_0827785 [Tanacetum coccineum]
MTRDVCRKFSKAIDPQGQKASDYDNTEPSALNTKSCTFSRKEQIRHNMGHDTDGPEIIHLEHMFEWKTNMPVRTILTACHRFLNVIIVGITVRYWLKTEEPIWEAMADSA